jgi:hypothetical protein
MSDFGPKHPGAGGYGREGGGAEDLPGGFEVPDPGDPEIPSGGWSQAPGWDTNIPDHYYYEYPPHMGKMEFGRYGARSKESDIYLTNIQSETDQDGRTHHTATDQHGNVWEWSYAIPHTGKDWEISYRDTDGREHEYYRLDDGTWAEDHALEDENLAKDHLPPPVIEGEEDHTGGRLPLPDTGIQGEEDHTGGRLPLPDTGIQGEENHTGGRLPLPDDTPIQAKDNLAKGHLPGLVDEEPPAEQSPPAEPPVQPNPPPPPDHGLQEHYAKDYGFPGLGVEPPPSVIGQPGLGEEDPAPPVPDPGPMRTLNPELLDPTAPGATLDYGLVEQIEQSPEMVDAINHNQDLARALEQDPTQLDQIAEYVSSVEPSFGVVESPAGVTGEPFTDPSLTEPNIPEPAPTGQDLDDLST